MRGEERREEGVAMTCMKRKEEEEEELMPSRLTYLLPPPLPLPLPKDREREKEKRGARKTTLSDRQTVSVWESVCVQG